jgi:hypothetical protein
MRATLPFGIISLSISIGLAAPFQNLDFEEYNPGTGVVPGWSFQNERYIGGPAPVTRLPLDVDVGLPFDIPLPYATMYSGAVAWRLADPGKYALGLHAVADGSGTLYHWYARQIGEIPPDAMSMSFELGFAQVVLKFDGMEMPLQYYYRTDTTWVGWDFADVSAFAGRTVTMEFTAPGRLEYLPAFSAPGAPRPYTLLDNIRFSSSPMPPIPEPRTLVLAVVGAAVMFMGRRLLKRLM